MPNINPAMNYYVGDKVVIGDRQMLRRCTHGMNTDMVDLSGQIATITKKYSDNYRIDIDNERWAWDDNCFYPYDPPEYGEDNTMWGEDEI